MVLCCADDTALIQHELAVAVQSAQKASEDNEVRNKEMLERAQMLEAKLKEKEYELSDIKAASNVCQTEKEKWQAELAKVEKEIKRYRKCM